MPKRKTTHDARTGTAVVAAVNRATDSKRVRGEDLPPARLEKRYLAAKKKVKPASRKAKDTAVRRPQNAARNAGRSTGVLVLVESISSKELKAAYSPQRVAELDAVARHFLP